MFISKAFAGNDFYYVYLSGPMPSDVKSHAIMQSLIRLATFPCHSRQQTGCALNCGWLRRAFFKACPPVACTIARPDLPARLGTPVDLRSTPIRGRGFAAYLSACGGQPLHRPRCGLRQGGFAHYVRLRHYRSSLLAAASKSLTFVRGADRACWAPRKWPWKPTNACLYWLPARPPQGALACAPGSSTLPPA